MTANSDITEQLSISGEKELSATNNVTLKLTGTDVDNMFVVTTGAKFSVTNMTLDGNGEGRLIDSYDQAVINIKDATLINGSTDSFAKVIDSASGANWQRYSGGAIHMVGTTLNLDQTIFENNRTKAVTPKRENPGDELPVGHGGAIMAKRGSVITVKGGEFRANQTGIAERDQDASGEGGAIEATESTVKIYDTDFDIVDSFNTGGAIKFEGSTGTIKDATFTITSTQGADFGIAGGAITSENSHLTIESTKMKTSPQARVREAGGLIQVVSRLPTRYRKRR